MRGNRRIFGSAARAAGLFALLALAGCKTELYTGLAEGEANEMIALLLQRGIATDKVIAKDGSDTISVEQSRFADAVSILRAAGYPHKRFDNMGDVFKAGGLVASPMEERARFLYALGQELSATVSQIDGVLSARVEVVLPQDDILDRAPTPSSASVFVRYDEASDVDKLVPQIKLLVADSVQGLGYDRVSVVLVPVPHATMPVAAAPASYGIADILFGAVGGAGLAALLVSVGWAFRRRLLPVVSRARLLVGQRDALPPPVPGADGMADLPR